MKTSAQRPRAPIQAFAALLLVAAFLAPAAPAAPAGPQGSAAAPLPVFPWHLPEWKSRLVVELASADAESRVNTGLILLEERPPRIQPDGRDLRVLDENGLPVKFRLVDEKSEPLAGEQPANSPFRIHFQITSPALKFYFVYFGNPAAPSALQEWEEKLGGLTLETRVNTARHAAGSWKDMMDLIAQSKWKFGQGIRRQINDTVNPFGPNEYFLSIYRGLLACPADGAYTFGTDSDDSSFLLIDRQLVVQWPGPHNESGRFDHAEKITLKAGVHQIEYYHVQVDGGTLARAGWQPPGAEHIVTIPAEAFVRELHTEVCAPEERDNPLSVFFKPEVVESYQFGASGPVLVVMAFENRSHSALGTVASREWDFGDGAVSLDENPRHVFVGGATYSVRLRCMDSLGFDGARTRDISTGSSASTRVEAAMEVSAGEALLLPGEPLAVTLKCRLGGTAPKDLPMSLLITVKGMDGAVLKRERAPLTAAPGAWQTFQQSLPGAIRGARTGEIAFQIESMGILVAEEKVLVRDASDPALKVSLEQDQITDAGGRPVALRLGGEPEPRRTPSAREKLAAGAANIVIVDDSLAGSGATGYPEMLAALLHSKFPAAKINVTRVGLASGSHSYQPLRGLVEFPTKVQAAKPDVVVVAASLRDVLRSTPVERFERTLQGLVDRIEAVSGAEVVLVAPPPTIANPGMAESYAAGVKRIGLRRGLPVADAYSAFKRAAADAGLAGSSTSGPAWREFYKDPDSPVPIYYVSPVARGQEIIAAAIVRALLETGN